MSLTPPLSPNIDEAQFTGLVVEVFQRCGWLVMHQRPARTNKGYRTAIQGNAGFPDIVATNGERFIIAELKTKSGRATLPQLDWLRRLREVEAILDDEAFAADDQAFNVYLWRPADWPEIVDIANNRRPPA